MRTSYPSDLEDMLRDPMAKSFFDSMTGQYLGSGASRWVYRLKHDQSKVVKVEAVGNLSTRQNVMEAEIWRAAKEIETYMDDDWHTKWLCPIHDLSPCGRFLVMDYARTMRDEERPDRVPFYLTDFKNSNWGMLNGRPVIRDYGITLLIQRGMYKRLAKANWFDPHTY